MDDKRFELTVTEIRGLIMACGIAWVEARTEDDAAFYLGLAEKLRDSLRN